ncbi:hypothetical protein NEIMUCOT_06667 [Neisseria mucosa ATCC 25996]|uniref:Uncharacterized protein n=1 Tax=Neisseria mucosa (strain ATCC 25996 / DSM 4631 / NCTC 10774 / M26) TaxID=546266 RepID=D3A174_NEIM2|nr:hypothetical protein NEIMUCOT_06667 [Neisseria mucosa ATCC 25996]
MPRLAVLSVLSAASSPCPDLNLIHYITPFRPTAAIRAGMSGSPNLSTIRSKKPPTTVRGLE